MIIEYKLVCSDSYSRFNDEVNALLKQGFQPSQVPLSRTNEFWSFRMDMIKEDKQTVCTK